MLGHLSASPTPGVLDGPAEFARGVAAFRESSARHARLSEVSFTLESESRSSSGAATQRVGVPMTRFEKRDLPCNCCDLIYEIEIDINLATPFQCGSCQGHRDASTPEAQLERFKAHEVLHKARVNEVMDWADACEAKMKSAYHTRGRALAVLNDINGVHDLRSDGLCRCGQRNCKVAKLITGDRVMFGLVRDYDRREQERLRRLESDDYWDYVDEWDDKIDPQVVTPRRPGTAWSADAS